MGVVHHDRKLNIPSLESLQEEMQFFSILVSVTQVDDDVSIKIFELHCIENIFVYCTVQELLAIQTSQKHCLPVSFYLHSFTNILFGDCIRIIFTDKGRLRSQVLQAHIYTKHRILTLQQSTTHDKSNHRAPPFRQDSFQFQENTPIISFHLGKVSHGRGAWIHSLDKMTALQNGHIWNKTTH